MEKNLAVGELLKNSISTLCVLGKFKGFLKVSFTIGKITT